MIIEKQVKGYEGLYSVSQSGIVKSLTRTRSMGRGREAMVKERILKQYDSGESMQVRLSKKGKSLTKTVHTIVFDAFVGDDRNGLVICHNDGDYKNNKLSNLRLDTQRSNIKDRLKHGNEVDGEKHRWTKINKKQALEIIGLRGKMTQVKIAKRYGITQTAVSNIQLGKCWKCLRR